MNSTDGKKLYDKFQSGMRIRQAREKAGLKAIDLAAELEISETQMSRIENGISGCTIETLIKTADVLSVSVDFLLSRAEIIESKGINRKSGEIRKEIEKKLELSTLSQMDKINRMIDIICN